MPLLPISKEDLHKYHNDKEVVQKTAGQVIKDFATFGYDISFPEDLTHAYDSLFDQLAPVIRDLLNQDATRLYALLYTIDLSEIAIRKGMNEMEGSEIYDTITHLVLERELKKVLTRLYFSRNL